MEHNCICICNFANFDRVAVLCNKKVFIKYVTKYVVCIWWFLVSPVFFKQNYTARIFFSWVKLLLLNFLTSVFQCVEYSIKSSCITLDNWSIWSNMYYINWTIRWHLKCHADFHPPISGDPISAHQSDSKLIEITQLLAVLIHCLLPLPPFL